MKKIVLIIIGVVVILALIAAGKDFIIKMSVEKGVEMVTGLKLSMRGFSVGIIRGIVRIEGLKLFNPPGFKDRVMVDMPEIYVNCDLPALFGGKLHLREMRIDLKEITVVKNEKGQLNLDSFKVVQAQKEGKQPESGTAAMPEMQIDELTLKAGKAVYKDYSSGGSPSVKEFNINLNEKYTNITDPYALVGLIIVRTLTNTTISNLANFDLRGLKGSVGDVLSRVQAVTGNVSGVAQRAVSATAQQTQAVTKTAEEAVKGVEDIFKSTFGGGK